MRTKQTAHGSKVQCPKGMATVTFSSGTDADPEQQQQEVAGGATEDSQDWPDVEETMQGVTGSSKSKDETGDQPQQAEGGAQAPPKEIPSAPELSNPKPGTSKDPTQDPTNAPAKDPTQDPTQPPQDPQQTATQKPDEDTPPVLTEYVKAYKQAGKLWLDTVVENKEQAYITLFDTLQQLGDPHIDYFDQANREQVFECIRDRTGRFLREDEFTIYVEQEEEKKKPRFNLQGEAKEALRDYYDMVHTLCEAQENFALSTQVLEKKIEDKSVFLDIIRQVQLPAVQVLIRTVEELEKLEGKTYRELTLLCHLPNFRRIFPNASEQTRTMAAYMYYVLYEQITGLRPSHTGCAADFRCGATLFKRLITGKKQPSELGRLSEARGGSSRKLEEVTEMEGATPAKQRKTTPTPKPAGG